MKQKKKASKIIEKKTLAVGSLFPLATLPALASMLVLGVLIYSNSFDCSFHFDDGPNITEQPLIRDFWNFSSWWNIQSTRQLGFGSFALTYHFFGYDVWGWHLFNLLIHLCAALAVWRLTVLLFRTPALNPTPMSAQASSIALAAAFLFVAHPLATQSVTYIVQRLAAQAALFYLLSLALYLEARLKGLSNPAAWLWLIGSFLAGISAILTKENAYTLPLAVLLLEIYLFQADQIGKLFRKKTFLFIAIPLLLVFLFFFYKNYHTLAHTISLDTGVKINAYNYLMTQFGVIWRYIQLLLVPIGQNLEHHVSLSESLFAPRTFVSFIGLVLLFGWAIYQFNRNRLLSFGIIWFFLTLSIESSFVPIADVMFEHRTYLPSYGFILALCAGIVYPLYRKSPPKASALLYGLVGIYAVLTYARNQVWKNDETLWSDVISKAPAPRAYTNRGGYYLRQKELEKAKIDFQQALKLNTAYPEALHGIAKMCTESGEFARAVENCTPLIDKNPNFLKAYLIRADAYVRLGRFDKALEDCNQVLKRAPADFFGQLNRIAALIGLQQYEDAVAASARLIEMYPEKPNAWYNRGLGFYHLNLPDSALVCFSKAIELDPNQPGYYKDRSVAFIKKGNIIEAVSDCSRALDLDPGNMDLLTFRIGCYLELKEWSKVNDDLDQFLSVSPNHPGALQTKNFVINKLKE
jgi:tetratricopeptide (TPR) repeat protein